MHKALEHNATFFQKILNRIMQKNHEHNYLSRSTIALNVFFCKDQALQAPLPVIPFFVISHHTSCAPFKYCIQSILKYH